ncbi:DUF998 domain-containing protein [Blastococcus sp. TF02A-30]|uniref:DUF998 domain-containing protein n=1 Tax=Blastococcus sp. TF02A-30 TaxID=2250580 RepID=UPI000DFBECC3|nr:DUF998 domain-containing protein [Blastococcus sp. TF02A-30]RBY87721.1 DUF998 domain-containing protein [Blastococcus sp. TF02A-30]
MVTSQRSHQATTPSARSQTTAGLLLLGSGAAVLLVIVTAEALYPAAYDSTVNTVSDLAAMRPDDVVRQPSAAIFNVAMVVIGAAIAVAAGLLARSRVRTSAWLPLAGLGLGMVLVGFFPGNTIMGVHQLVSLLAFVSGGLAAVLTARLLPRPLRPVQVVLGIVALGFLLGYELLGELAFFEELGEGGTERWIVYTVSLSLVVLGSGLAAGPPVTARGDLGPGS